MTQVDAIDRAWAEFDRIDSEVATLYRDFDVAISEAMPRARAQHERALKFGPRPTRSTT